jgi:hypothetical protein
VGFKDIIAHIEKEQKKVNDNAKASILRLKRLIQD